MAPKGPATTETEVPAGLDLDPRIDLWWNAAGDQMAFIDDPDGAGALTVGPAHDLSVVGFAVGSLAWHPTDSRLAFVAEDFSGVADRWLFVVVAGRDLRSDGLVERQIALDSGEVAIAAWGDWGYLLEAQEGGRTVFVMRSLDGRNRGEPVPLRPSHGAPKAPRFGWP